MNVVLYNDTTVAFGQRHFGCQLVMHAFRSLISDAGMNLIGTIPLDEARVGTADKELMAQADLIIVNGEGSLHHNRRPDLLSVGKTYPAVLINTVFDRNDTDGLDDYLYLAARESLSAKAMSCKVVPDVIFTLFKNEPKGSGHIEVMHGTGVSTMRDDVVTAIKKCETVKTESFHAGCLAAMFGRDLEMVNTTTHKNKGLCIDLGINMNTLGSPDPDYAIAANHAVRSMFHHISKLL